MAEIDYVCYWPNGKFAAMRRMRSWLFRMFSSISSVEVLTLCFWGAIYILMNSGIIWREEERFLKSHHMYLIVCFKSQIVISREEIIGFIWTTFSREQFKPWNEFKNQDFLQKILGIKASERIWVCIHC